VRKPRKIQKRQGNRSQAEDERRLLILQFLIGEPDGSAVIDYIKKHAMKLNAQDHTRVRSLCETMVDMKWLDLVETPTGGGKVVTTYKISENGRLALKTAQELKHDDNPLAKLMMFDKLD
jgi:DNA-binding PadR family transcriptional regulator